MEAQVKSEGETRTLLAVRDVQLECVMHRNAYASSKPEEAVAVVILHPYSWLGGSMYDHVVRALYSAFASTGKFNTVLAYNSRGVGKSSGRTSMYGAKKEVEDLRALCRSLLGNLTHPPAKIVLVGYSHGSCVAAGASMEPYVTGVCAVSPPVGALASSALGLKDLWKVFCEAQAPKFVALGTADTFCSEKALRKKSQGSNADIKIYRGADHFWSSTGALQALQSNLLEWVCKTLLV